MLISNIDYVYLFPIWSYLRQQTNWKENSTLTTIEIALHWLCCLLVYIQIAVCLTLRSIEFTYHTSAIFCVNETEKIVLRFSSNFFLVHPDIFDSCSCCSLSFHSQIPFDIDFDRLPELVVLMHHCTNFGNKCAFAKVWFTSRENSIFIHIIFFTLCLIFVSVSNLRWFRKSSPNHLFLTFFFSLSLLPSTNITYGIPTMYS